MPALNALLSRLFLSLCLLALAACSSTGGGVREVRAGTDALPPPDTTDAAGAYQGTSEYRLGANDQVEISVFGVQDLTKTVRINTNGQISLPLIGAVPAGGMTIPELESELTRRYAGSYLQNPQVTVFVKEFSSQRITLEGAVRQPGIYPLTGKTTLLQAIAMAEGLDKLADPRGVVVFRNIDGKRMGAAFDLVAVRRGEVVDPQVYGDDVIVVETSGSRTAVREFIDKLGVFAMFLAL